MIFWRNPSPIMQHVFYWNPYTLYGVSPILHQSLLIVICSTLWRHTQKMDERLNWNLIPIQKTVWTIDLKKSRIWKQMWSSQLMMMSYFLVLLLKLPIVYGRVLLIQWLDLSHVCIGWINLYVSLFSLSFLYPNKLWA